MKTIVAIHGVSVGGDDLAAGYGARVEAALKRSQAGSRFELPRVVEAKWASIAQDVVSSASLERAELLMASAGGPLLVGAVALLQRLGAAPLSTLADYAVDVVIYADPTHRRRILDHVRAQIDAHPGCVVLAHSLGSVIAVDLMIEDLAAGRDPRPLVTCGSPLGVTLPFGSRLGFTDRSTQLQLYAPQALEWIDYYDQDDPIVDGRLFGDVEPGGLERFAGYAGVGVQSLAIDTGGTLPSHLGYWDHDMIAGTSAALCDLI